MSLKRTPRPRDPVQLGKLMLDIVTGEVPDAIEDGKDAVAQERGQAGGAKGGVSRAASLAPDQRRAIAQKAADARWRKTPT